MDMDILIAMADNHLEVVIETGKFFLSSDKLTYDNLQTCAGSGHAIRV